MDYIVGSYEYFRGQEEEQNEEDNNNMIVDALRWNMLNIIRVELVFNCYTLWRIFAGSPKGEGLSSARGHYAIVSLLITLMAQFSFQFNFGWLLTVYAIYLAIGMCSWLHKRVYFYHRRQDLLGITQTLRQIDVPTTVPYTNGLHGGNHHTNTLKPGKHNQHANSESGSSSSTTSSTSSTTTTSSSTMISAMNNPDHHQTNSLQRQRVSAYRNFQSVLTEPRYNHREYAMSLAHLSDVSKLVAGKDVFDEMHFQILATRRDVVNMILRAILFSASTLLAYLR